MSSGGTYMLEMEGPYKVPVFTFHAVDLAAIERLLTEEVVHFEVRRQNGLFTYYLFFPDLGLQPPGIPVRNDDVLHVAAGQEIRGGITTRVTDARGCSLSLDAFTQGIKHDWSGLHDDARRALEQLRGGAIPSAELEQPLRTLRSALADLDSRELGGHLLVGRWLALRGDGGGAIDAFYRAVEGGRASWTDPRLLPAAAEPIAELGLAYAEQKMDAAARICLEHALHIRPKYAAARSVFARLTATPAEALDLAAVRADARLGDHDYLRERLDALA